MCIVNLSAEMCIKTDSRPAAGDNLETEGFL